MDELLCWYCLVEQRMDTAAATLIEGTAVCKNHAPEIAEQREAHERDVMERVADFGRGSPGI